MEPHTLAGKSESIPAILTVPLPTNAPIANINGTVQTMPLSNEQKMMMETIWLRYHESKDMFDITQAKLDIGWLQSMVMQLSKQLDAKLKGSKVLTEISK